ncbi:unnamed protein product, partial [Musa acuminata var. zebrina]
EGSPIQPQRVLPPYLTHQTPLWEPALVSSTGAVFASIFLTKVYKAWPSSAFREGIY